MSSPQLDRPERGFSVRAEGPIDGPMNPKAHAPAGDRFEGFRLLERAVAAWAAPMASGGRACWRWRNGLTPGDPGEAWNARKVPRCLRIRRLFTPTGVATLNLWQAAGEDSIGRA